MQNLRQNRDILLLGGGMIAITLICGCFFLLAIIVMMSGGDEDDPVVQNQPTAFVIATTQAPAITPTRQITPTPTTQTNTNTSNNTGNTGPTGSVVSATLNLRSGPSTAYPILSTLSSGQTLKLTGRTSDNAWVQVQLTNGTSGWVSTTYIDANITISSLPVASAPPPPPTTAPTATTAASPQLTINPTIGYIGTEVFATVANFPANTRVELHLGLGPNQYASESVVSATTNSSGAVSMSFIMPAEWTRGVPITSAIFIAAVTPDWRYTALAQFSWNPPLTAPRISINPTEGKPGTPIAVTLTGFPPNTDFGIHLGRSETSYDAGAWVVGRTDANGYVLTGLTLPANWQDNTPITGNDLYIIARTNDGRYTVAAKLLFTPNVQTTQ